MAASPLPLPDELLEFLRFSNGGEGPLALAPLIFVLDNVERIVQSFDDPFLLEEFPDFLFFGGNGGLETIAFDTRGGMTPWPVVMIDQIAGPESAVTIAPSFDAFIEAVGLEPLDDVT